MVFCNQRKKFEEVEGVMEMVRYLLDPSCLELPGVPFQNIPSQNAKVTALFLRNIGIHKVI